MSRQVAELRAALAGLDDEQRERLGRDWRRTIERKEKEMKKPPILEGQTYFTGHAAPAPKKRSSPKPTTTKKGSV
jgi:hypothetical protein